MLPSQDSTAQITSQTERVIIMLREMVLGGQFRPGERLVELNLAPLLNASRTPVRLALERLAHQGLLEPMPKTGFRVREFSLAEIRDAIEVRGVLEGTAARLAAERLTSPDELAELRRSCEALAAFRGPLDIETFFIYTDENVKFHQELWRLAKSSMLIRSLEMVGSLPFAEPGAAIFAGGAPADSRAATVSLEHHFAITEAIGNREGTRAEYLAREHARMARRRLDAVVSNPDLLNRFPGASLIALGKDSEPLDA